MYKKGYSYSKLFTHLDQNVLWFNVSVKYTILVHVINGLTELVHEQPYFGLSQI